MSFREVGKGDRLGEFVLERKLGRGPTCDVWMAAHHVLDGRASVKAGRAEGAESVIHAAGLMQHAVRHERIPRTLGLNLDHDPPFLVTELVEGRSLRRLLAESSNLPWEKALDLFRDLLAALDATHDRGVAHGNLKPENLLAGDDGRWYVTDFGAVRAGADQDRGLLSGVFGADDAESLKAGPYSPPEAGQGKEPGAGADVWACGIILFEALTGRLPQGGEAPSDLVKGLPVQADEAFRGAYARLERRFGTTNEFAAALFRSDAPQEPDELVAKIVSCTRRIPTNELPVAAIEEVRMVASAARCPACSHRNGLEYKFCVRCGAPLSMMGLNSASCISCGRPKFHRHRFCPFCGGRYS